MVSIVYRTRVTCTSRTTKTRTGARTTADFLRSSKDSESSFVVTCSMSDALVHLSDPFHILDCWQCVGWKGQSDPLYQCHVKL